MARRRTHRFVAGFLTPFAVALIAAGGLLVWRSGAVRSPPLAASGGTQVVQAPEMPAQMPTQAPPPSLAPPPAAQAERADESISRLNEALQSRSSEALRLASEEGAAAPPAPEFPWPPPTPSTSYSIPNSYFAGAGTVGVVANTITHALETSGYVERRYYALPIPGVALVTRLERINEDGSPASERWSTGALGGTSLYQLLRGLYFTDPGHYRVIVFLISRGLHVRSPRTPSIEEAKAWLNGGLDDMPDEVAAQDYKGAHTVAYLYDFVSRNGALTLDREVPPAEDQLARAGVLTAMRSAVH